MHVCIYSWEFMGISVLTHLVVFVHHVLFNNSSLVVSNVILYMTTFYVHKMMISDINIVVSILL